ncbi:hypothetical protein R6Q59_022364 [Mikania micrantha]|uniref:Oleosin n=1 Tax=Mikania micrantha TaxID=192012 RepID=A0A5N6MWJ3_9ASTR|nr:hypothetical protein E3N88_27404 [Mikania micrantha]
METQYHSLTHHQHQQQQMSIRTLMIATIVGITIGGPLLALMGFIFLATMALFVATSPLLVIFSPVILGAVFVAVAALAGFGAAGLLAIAGLSALGWVFRLVKSGQLQQGLEGVTGKLLETGENTEKEWGDDLKLSEQKSPENVTSANRA